MLPTFLLTLSHNPEVPTSGPKTLSTTNRIIAAFPGHFDSVVDKI